MPLLLRNASATFFGVMGLARLVFLVISPYSYHKSSPRALPNHGGIPTSSQRAEARACVLETGAALGLWINALSHYTLMSE